MKKYAIGDWYHMFGPGRRETRCRIVIDLEQSKLVAAQEWTGLKFVDVLGDRLKDLAESVIEVNQAHAKVEEWAPDPEFADELPEWVSPKNLSNYIEHSDTSKTLDDLYASWDRFSLNTDPTLIEARVMKDYAHYLGKDVLVKGICGFVGDDSTDVELSPPAKVRVEATSEQSLKRWIDGWCDPLYEVTLVENHPQLNGMRSLWIHGPSLHLNGKQTEASDIVSIAEQPKPRQDDSPSP